MTRSPHHRERNPPARPRRRRRVAISAALALLVPLLLLATCGPPGDVGLQLAALAPYRPVPPPTGPAHFTGDAFITADGARLPLRKWLPDGRVRAVILGLHGFGDYSRGFAIPARRWARRGIATYAYDQRGFGAAPDRGRWAGEGPMTVDAIVASRILRRMYPGRPLYLLGESMGGAVAVLAMSGAEHGVIPGPGGVMPRAEADGVILGAPAVWGRLTMDFWPKAALFLAARLFPNMVMTGRGLRILASDNIPMLRQLSLDPLVEKGARVGTIFGLVDLMDDALAAAPHLTAPMLLLYGARDQIVPKSAIRDFTAHLPPAAREHDRLAYYPHGYHLLLRDLDGAAVAQDVASWIFDHRAALPSHADWAQNLRPWPPAATSPAWTGAATPLASAAKAQ
jgi:alpha-beta hydrolase superfamily lysophospholipase